jgi:hypothetical protein
MSDVKTEAMIIYYIVFQTCAQATAAASLGCGPFSGRAVKKTPNMP